MHIGVAIKMRRFSPEEIAGDLLDYAERVAPEHAQAVQGVVDEYFAAQRRRAPEPDAPIADLYDALPEEFARQAEAIFRRHVESAK